MSQVQGMPGKLKVSDNYTNKAIFTHNDEQLEDNSKLCFETIIAQSEKEEGVKNKAYPTMCLTCYPSLSSATSER